MAVPDERLGGINFDWANPDSASSLSRAVREKNLGEVRRLISTGVSLDVADNRGSTALHEAAKDDACLKIAAALIKSGAFINHATFGGETPLFTACASSSHKIVRLFIQHKCNINQSNLEGMTPLHVACRQPNTNIVESLLKAGADVNKKNNSSETPIFLAIEYGNCESCELLLKYGADLTLRDDDRRTPLYIACSSPNHHLFDLLLAQTGLSIINQQNEEGWTLLMEAAQFANVHIVRKLIDSGADTSLTDHRKLLALHIAAHSSSFECFEMILNKTKVDVIERYVIPSDLDMIHTISLPCLLIDINLYQGLQLLFNSSLSEDVFTCPVMIGRHLYSPVSFLLLYAETIDSQDKLKYLDLLLSRKGLSDPDYWYPSVSTLEAAIRMHNETHENCICMEALIRILDQGAQPDKAAFKAALRKGYMEALKLLLRYTTLEPENVLREYFETISLFSLIVRLEHEMTFLQFFSNCCIHITHPGFFQESLKFTEMVAWLRKTIDVPSLKKISRSALRKQLRSESGSNFLTHLDQLNIPKSVVQYIRFYDL